MLKRPTWKGRCALTTTNMSVNILSLTRLMSRAATITGFALFLITTSPAATTTNVSVQDNSFSPATVQINTGDTVKWNWTGFNPHSSTSTSSPGLWESAVHGNGFTFSHTFPSGGTFPYECTVHAFLGMLGTVKVQAPVNVPPTVVITGPTNGANFSAPWGGLIKGTASDPDDTVSKVTFFAGTNQLGSITNPPGSFSFTVPNLAAGSYLLKAVGTDSRGATNTSAAVTINVINAAPIELSSALRQSSTSFQFTYSANPGLSYIVRRAGVLPNWANIATNAATGNAITFVDANATDPVNFYSIQLAPNP